MKLPWKYILVSGTIGLLLGASGGLYRSRDLARHWIQTSPERYLKHLNHELRLSESQQAQILMLLDNRRDKLIAYEDQIRQQTRQEIHDRLTPEQQPRFEILAARHDAERQKREAR